MGVPPNCGGLGGACGAKGDWAPPPHRLSRASPLAQLETIGEPCREFLNKIVANVPVMSKISHAIGCV